MKKSDKSNKNISKNKIKRKRRCNTISISLKMVDFNKERMKEKNTNDIH